MKIEVEIHPNFTGPPEWEEVNAFAHDRPIKHMYRSLSHSQVRHKDAEVSTYPSLLIEVRSTKYCKCNKAPQI